MCVKATERVYISGGDVHHMDYLVNFLLGVSEEGREVAQGVTVKNHLGLFISTSHYVPNSSQGSSLCEMTFMFFQSNSY